MKGTPEYDQGLFCVPLFVGLGFRFSVLCYVLLFVCLCFCLLVGLGCWVLWDGESRVLGPAIEGLGECRADSLWVFRVRVSGLGIESFSRVSGFRV